MSHHHHHHHAPEGNTAHIRVAFFLNLAFTLVEIAGGLWTNSMAILSDALHDLGDSLSLGLAWYFQKLSTKKGDRKYSFGYQRFSLLGAIINGMILIIGSVFVLQEAIGRLWQPEATHAAGMMGLAVVGIVVNGAAVLRLKKGSSLNERVVSLHLLEDVLGWVAVLVGGAIMYVWEVPILDPLLSIGISLYVLWNVYGNLRQSFRILLQAVPTDKDMGHIRQKILELPEVAEVHDIHLWSMDGHNSIFTVHLRTRELMSMEEIGELKQTIRGLLEAEHIHHATIEVEHPGEQHLQMDC
ncbi:MAG: cation transporter [Bacteroidetes bacterium]|nr:MAG: cation transporter [Bacteroidota bacterium]